jgi:predicted transcriptional regulator
MTTILSTDQSKPNKERLDLIESFEADFNAVEHFLEEALGLDGHLPFAKKVTRYSKLHRGWEDAALLRVIAKVRNVIVHGKNEPYGHVAIPTPELAHKLKACLDRLTHPSLAIPTFERQVQTISLHSNLAEVLKVIKQRDYSQFPVYASERFLGLLTENGITRWLAHHVTRKLSLVELEEVTVKEMLENEEVRKNYHFTPKNTRVDDIVGQFASEEMLEAVLITCNGTESERLLGIATRWDIFVHLGLT